MLTIVKVVAWAVLAAAFLTWLAFNQREITNALRNTDDFLAG